MSTQSLMLCAVTPSRNPATSSGTLAKIAPGTSWKAADSTKHETINVRTPTRTLAGGVTAAAATKPAAVTTASSPRSAKAGATSLGACR